MSASEPIHPTLNDLKFEIGQVLVCWSFLENTMRERLNRAGLQEKILKAPVISHWQTYIKATYPDRAQELLEPIEKSLASETFSRTASIRCMQIHGPRAAR